MKTKAVVCLLWLAGSLASAQSSMEPSHGSVSLLIALENAWNRAQLSHDSKALEGLLADTFVSTDDHGIFMNKSQFLLDNKDLSYAPSLMANQDERVFIYENAGGRTDPQTNRTDDLSAIG